MPISSLAAQAAATGPDVPLPVSIAAWLFCLAALSPAVWRLLRRRYRTMDPIWSLVALLAVNRLSFLLKVPPLYSHGTAVLLAIAMAALSWSYQRTDREVKRAQPLP